MAKYFTPAWLDAVSGKIDNMVFALKTRILPVRGVEAAGYMRKFVYAIAQSARVNNVNEGFKLLSAEWKLLTGSEQITWSDDAGLRSSVLGYDITGRDLFMSYYLTKLTHGLSTYFRVAALGVGTSANYVDRETRQFTSAIV